MRSLTQELESIESRLAYIKRGTTKTKRYEMNLLVKSKLLEQDSSAIDVDWEQMEGIVTRVDEDLLKITTRGRGEDRQLRIVSSS